MLLLDYCCRVQVGHEVLGFAKVLLVFGGMRLFFFQRSLLKVQEIWQAVCFANQPRCSRVRTSNLHRTLLKLLLCHFVVLSARCIVANKAVLVSNPQRWLQERTPLPTVITSS